LPGKIDSPRFEELEDEFIQNGGEWRVVEIDQLFKKLKTNLLPYHAEDLKNKHDEVYSLPVLTAGLENQGLAYYVPRENATILKNVISVSANGANTGVMFYQPNEFTVLQDSYAIEFKGKVLNEKEYLFMLSALQKAIRFRFDWSNKAGWKKIRNERICLPFLKGELCFSYMERYIREIERVHLEALDSYLKDTRLKDYELTLEEMQALENFNASTVKMSSFLLGDIFNITSSKQKFNADSLNFGGRHPYIARGESNNGVRGYIDENECSLNDGNTISFGQDTATMFYQPSPYFTGDKIKVLRAKGFTLNKYLALYSIATTKKILGTFSWGSTSYKVSNLENIELTLPIKEDGDTTPDYHFMETLIKAIEKLLMKDVRDWLDKRLEITKDVLKEH